MMDEQTRSVFNQATSILKPVLWLRDRERIKQIENARTAEELVDLVDIATGLGETTWQDRMREFGPEVVPAISKRLKTISTIRDEEVRDMALERLIGELRWRGDAGAQVLIECFDDLSDYGKSLASVTLGLLGARVAADKVWAFYQKAGHDQRETHFVGALWGLIDLRDKRAADALADLLREGRHFYELFGFLSMAGDARAVAPLVRVLAQMPKEESLDHSIALIGIAHRIGRDALMAEIRRLPFKESEEELEAGVDEILARPASMVEEHFELFYRGITPDDLAEILPRTLR